MFKIPEWLKSGEVNADAKIESAYVYSDAKMPDGAVMVSGDAKVFTCGELSEMKGLQND